MRTCRKMRGLIAASVYEALDPEEQIALDVHLAACAACRAEAKALRAFVGEIPRPSVAFEGDLLPVLRDRLAEERSPRGTAHLAFRVAVSISACLLIVALLGYGLVLRGGVAPHQPVVVVASPVEKILVESPQRASRDFLGARMALEEVLAAHPDDPRAGEAQQLLAELEFGHGQRYAEAYDGYAQLRAQYPETWKKTPENVLRFNLLDEARASGFEPLYALDAARNSSDNPLAELEKVVAQYPNTYLASRAIAAMCEVVGQERADSGAVRVAALETVRARCTHPIAIAQINADLGGIYWKDLNDPAKAQTLYAAVAESENPALAELAREALTKLAAAAAP